MNYVYCLGAATLIAQKQFYVSKHGVHFVNFLGEVCFGFHDCFWVWGKALWVAYIIAAILWSDQKPL